jgi:hypothetical protein
MRLSAAASSYRAFISAVAIAVGMSFSPNSNSAAAPAARTEEHTSDPCRLPFPLPDDVRIYATGSYIGRRTSLTIDPSAETGEFDIRVHEADAPVVLMLGSNSAAVWRVSWSHQTRLIGVYASGHGRQVVEGLPDSIPIILSFGASTPCPKFYVYPSELTSLNPISRSVFGRSITRVVYAEDGAATIGKPTSDIEFITFQTSTGRGRTLIPYGDAGLAEAVRLGQIRPATWADIETYGLGRDRQAKPSFPVIQHGAVSAGRPTAGGPYRTYIVLKPFEFPPGLSGALASTFIVPPGAPRPTGYPGHSTVVEVRPEPMERGK